jgi:hypothetical protein
LFLGAVANPPGGQAATRPAPIRPPRTAAANTPAGAVLDWRRVSGAPRTAVKGKALAARIGADGPRGARGRRARGLTVLEPESRGGQRITRRVMGDAASFVSGRSAGWRGGWRSRRTGRRNVGPVRHIARLPGSTPDPSRAMMIPVHYPALSPMCGSRSVEDAWTSVRVVK